MALVGLATKQVLGRLVLPVSFEVMLDAMGFSVLPVNLAHTRALAGLPLHHRAPFDRMLIAQARREGLTLVASDKRMQRDKIAALW